MISPPFYQWPIPAALRTFSSSFCMGFSGATTLSFEKFRCFSRWRSLLLSLLFFGKWIWRLNRCYEKTKWSFKFLPPPQPSYHGDIHSWGESGKYPFLKGKVKKDPTIGRKTETHFEVHVGICKYKLIESRISKKVYSFPQGVPEISISCFLQSLYMKRKKR